MIDASRARDGDHMVGSGQQPGEGDLRRRTALRRSQVAQGLYQVQIAGQILALESRVVPAAISFGEIFRLSNVAAEDAAPQRRIGDKANSKLKRQWHDVAFGVA